MPKVPFWKQFYQTVVNTEKKIIGGLGKAVSAPVKNAQQVEMKHAETTSPGVYTEKNPDGTLKMEEEIKGHADL